MRAKVDRQALRSRATQDRIVQAALKIIALKGLSEASMDDFCLAAGSSKGGLYHHFRTKGDVLSAVIERLAGANALVPPFTGTESSLGLPAAGVGRVLIEVWSAAARNAELRLQLYDAYEARRRLELDDVSPPGLVELLRIGTLIQLLTRGEAIDLSEAARQLGIERAA